MNISEFDFDLPPELIAQHPLPRRDESRLMVVRRADGGVEHRRFRDLPESVNAGDVLVLNDVRVLPAKIWGDRDGARVEFLFVSEVAPGEWQVLCRPAKKARRGDRFVFGPSFAGTVTALGARGLRTLRFDAGVDVRARLREAGYAPLPPYIKRRREDAAARPEDLERYQTVFARREGAIAAPTAGLHFTPEILSSLASRGAEVRSVTLDVGLATFQPVRVETVEEHVMLEERYEVPDETAARVNAAKSAGRPVVAVGTTVVRTLESAWGDTGLRPGPGRTSLFIRPGYRFRAVDRLLTNFHLPKSTLLMLVCAFGGTELIQGAYHEAVRERYRFFSYGDAMLIL